MIPTYSYDSEYVEYKQGCLPVSFNQIRTNDELTPNKVFVLLDYDLIGYDDGHGRIISVGDKLFDSTNNQINYKKGLIYLKFNIIPDSSSEIIVINSRDNIINMSYKEEIRSKRNKKIFSFSEEKECRGCGYLFRYKYSECPYCGE